MNRSSISWALSQMAEVAGRQEGVIAHRQLVALGLSRKVIERLVADGHLHRVYVGVYLVGHTAPAQHAAEMAALLAVGEGAVLSHRTAAVLLGLTEESPPGIELTLAGRTPSERPGMVVHKASSISASEVIRMGALLVTSPERTLLDLAPRLDGRPLRWAIEEARVRKLTTASRLRELIARHPGRRGVARLRLAVEELTGEPTVTRSEIERRLLDIVRGSGLPRPRANVRIYGWSVDLHWPEQRLVAEADGFAYHGGREAFERDRRKDAALQAAGLRVVRLSWRQVADEPMAVAALLGRLLTAD
jgi:very-short-patch-repair endonuclease